MPRLSARHSVPLLLSLCCSEAVVLSWPDRLAHWLLTKLARRKAHGVAAATLSATGARCTIAEEGPELPLSLFAERYREAQQPVVIRNATIRLQAAQRFRELSRVSRLLAEFGDRQVTGFSNIYPFSPYVTPHSPHISEFNSIFSAALEEPQHERHLHTVREAMRACAAHGEAAHAPGEALPLSAGVSTSRGSSMWWAKERKSPRDSALMA